MLSAVCIFLCGATGILISTYPYIVPHSMTISEAASPDHVLQFMMYGVCISMPVLLFFTANSYYVFKGKVEKPVHYWYEAKEGIISKADWLDDDGVYCQCGLYDYAKLCTEMVGQALTDADPNQLIKQAVWLKSACYANNQISAGRENEGTGLWTCLSVILKCCLYSWYWGVSNAYGPGRS